MSLDVYSSRRQIVADQIRDLIKIRGPRTQAQKQTLESLLDETRELEAGISREYEVKKDLAFRAWIRYGERRLDYDQRSMLEHRDMTEGTPSGGAYPGSSEGFLVPLGFRSQVESAMRFAGPMMDVGTVVDTPTGNVMPFPMVNDTGEAGLFLLEGQQVSLSDIGAIAQTVMGSYLVGSSLRLSISLLEDSSGFDAPGFISRVLGVRLGRALEPAFTTGAGGGTGPTGFITASSQAGVAVGAGANDLVSASNSLGSGDVASLLNSVDPSYRKDAIFMCHPSTLQALQSQRDQRGALLFPELRNSELRLLNYPLVLNPQMDQLQTQSSSPQVTRNVLAFGDFKRMVIRRGPMTLIRLSEKYAEFRQVAFLCLYRVDSNLIDGGGGAIKYISALY
jgi:HK97 family phage major capsid protein